MMELEEKLARAANPGDAPWSMAAIPYHAIVREQVVDDEVLFYIVTSASFVEITSDLYTKNLIDFFGGDSEVVAWLENGWEPEELQHGASLKRYVQCAWPDFDWEASYRSFLGEYSNFCSPDSLEQTRALEMVARCVVETGTSSFYKMLMDIATEPVLKQIAEHISADEVRHYKHFYHYFLRYQEKEQPGRAAVLRTLWSRAMEVDAEDGFIAFKHAFLHRHPGDEFDPAKYDAFRAAVRERGKAHFPFEMALKMFVKPLGLAPVIGRMMLPPATMATRLFLLR
jgi:hypothetical protein